MLVFLSLEIHQKKNNKTKLHIFFLYIKNALSLEIIMLWNHVDCSLWWISHLLFFTCQHFISTVDEYIIILSRLKIHKITFIIIKVLFVCLFKNISVCRQVVSLPSILKRTSIKLLSSTLNYQSIFRGSNPHKWGYWIRSQRL